MNRGQPSAVPESEGDERGEVSLLLDCGRRHTDLAGSGVCVAIAAHSYPVTYRRHVCLGDLDGPPERRQRRWRRTFVRPPSDWTVRLPEGQVGVPHSVVVLYLSNQPLHSICQRQGTLNVLGCGGQPLEGLEPDGVFVEWWIGRGMGWNPPPEPDRRLTIGGRKAMIVLGSSCAPITGVERSMRVFIERSPSSGDVLDGCFRGPATDEAIAQFLAMAEAMF